MPHILPACHIESHYPESHCTIFFHYPAQWFENRKWTINIIFIMSEIKVPILFLKFKLLLIFLNIRYSSTRMILLSHCRIFLADSNPHVRTSFFIHAAVFESPFCWRPLPPTVSKRRKQSRSPEKVRKVYEKFFDFVFFKIIEDTRRDKHNIVDNVQLPKPCAVKKRIG